MEIALRKHLTPKVPKVGTKLIVVTAPGHVHVFKKG